MDPVNQLVQEIAERDRQRYKQRQRRKLDGEGRWARTRQKEEPQMDAETCAIWRQRMRQGLPVGNITR